TVPNGAVALNTSGTATFTGAVVVTSTGSKTVVGNAANTSGGTRTAPTFTRTITVNAACTAASVTTQPTNQSITYGANASFTAAGAGNPAPSVRWQVSTNNGGTWNDLAGETS